MELRIIEETDALTHLALAGRLDVVGVAEIETWFHAPIAARKCDAILDLTDLEFIGSLGVGLIMGCAATLRQRGARMVLVNPNPSVAQVFHATNAGALAPIVDSVRAARDVLDAPVR